MKKIFISQPMREKTDEEILNERSRMIDYAKEKLGEDIEVIDSFFQGCQFEGKTPLYFLSKSIEKLSEADVAVFAPGWHTTRGCVIEYDCAQAYGVKIIEYGGRNECEE